MKGVVAVVGGLAVLAYMVLSYRYVRSVAAAANADPHLLWLWPIVIEGPMLGTFLALLVRARLSVRLYAGAIFTLSASGTAIADVVAIRAGGTPHLSLPAAMGISALPPVGWMAMLYLVTLLVRTRTAR
jgi:hypothetical protein